MATKAVRDAPLFLNRELSWLAFNERVLEEAADTSTPLLERLKFVAIAGGNLDEFFMVRVASLQQAVAGTHASVDPSGLPAAEQLAAVARRSHEFVAALYDLTTRELLPSLARHDIRIVPFHELPDPPAVTAMFRAAVLPVLTPLAVDASRPFPLLASLSLNLAVVLAAVTEEDAPRLAIVQVPGVLTRLVPVPGATGCAYVLLEEIIRAHLPELFPGQQILEATVMRLTRDAELELDEEGGRTHLETVEREVRRRRRSDVVRLEVESTASSGLTESLRDRLELDLDDVRSDRVAAQAGGGGS